MPRVAVVAFAPLLAMTLACPGGSRRGSGDGGITTLDLVGRSCTVDAECGGLRCDKVRRQCICLSDDSCKSGNPEDPPRFCNNFTGLCVLESDLPGNCTSDAKCQSGQYCDPSIRTCRPVKSFCEPCVTDNECGGYQDNCNLDEKLQQKFCGKACNETSDCPRGSACTAIGAVKQCWPAPNPITQQATTCRDFRGCTPDSLKTCNGPDDCAGLEGQKCDPARGKCVAVQQVCPFGTVCDPRNKICVAECTQDPDCGDPRLVCRNRTCEPVSECKNDDQCPANRVCSIAPGRTEGQCVPFCQDNSECPLGQQCKRATDGRYRCTASCTANQQCPPDQRCNLTSGQCEASAGATRACIYTSACNLCELCDGVSMSCQSARQSSIYGGYASLCMPCGGDAECGAGICVAMTGGAFCARQCGAGLAECPQGFICGTRPDGRSGCVPFDQSCTAKCK